MLVVWLIVSIFFLIIEILTVSFFALFLSIGAFITTILLSLDFVYSDEWSLQMLIFGLVSMISFFSLNNFFKKKFNKQGETLTDDFLGKPVVCLTEFNQNNSFMGQVEFQGSHWKAKAHEIFTEGEIAFIDVRDNLTLIIKKENKK